MVKWMPHARRQLRHIHDYIAQNSQHYAKQVTQELVQKSMTLDALPRIGRVVPELNEKTVREVSLYSYGAHRFAGRETVQHQPVLKSRLRVRRPAQIPRRRD
jgi:plasmid stabilization system protein ParE